jgi:hypothetical protein
MIAAKEIIVKQRLKMISVLLLNHFLIVQYPSAAIIPTARLIPARLAVFTSFEKLASNAKKYTRLYTMQAMDENMPVHNPSKNIFLDMF